MDEDEREGLIRLTYCRGRICPRLWERALGLSVHFVLHFALVIFNKKEYTISSRETVMPR